LPCWPPSWFASRSITVADQTPAAIAARQAASTIAIVFSFVGDPLGTKLAWGNATGMPAGTVEITGKSDELVRELLPTQRIAVLGNESDPFAKPYVEAIGDACGRVGMQMEAATRRAAGSLEPVFERRTAARASAMIVQGRMVRKEVKLALLRRLPSIAASSVWTQLGGLVTYSAHLGAMMKATASYVGKILEGSKPGDLPVVFPTRFELTINLKTAKALGLQIPVTLLGRAGEAIE
jgi:putative tryptophan/tyrosine transport system substrate-binding protein